MTALHCSGCGGPHRFDTTVPSVLWNEVIRASNLPEYLCVGCIVLAFVAAGRSFTATLWGDGLDGIPIEMRLRGEVATDADMLSEENTRLRAELFRITNEYVELSAEMRRLQTAVREELERSLEEHA